MQHCIVIYQLVVLLIKKSDVSIYIDYVILYDDVTLVDWVGPLGVLSSY